MHSHQLISLSLINLLLLFSSAIAQTINTTCSDPSFAHVNATGSTTITGLHPNGSVPGYQNANWTVHTGLKDMVSAGNSSKITQKWWLTTDPVISTPPADFPFDGCVFVLGFIQGDGHNSPTASTTSGENTCKNTFSDTCQSEIISTLDDYILSKYNTSANICGDAISDFVLSTPFPSCQQSSWQIVQVTNPFGNPDFVNYDGCAVGNYSVFNGSGESGSLMSVFSGDVPNRNYTYYDEFIDMTMPLVLTMWPENSTTPWQPDTRLVCVQPSTIEAGSHDPASGASRGGVNELAFTLGVIAISILVIL